MADELFGKVLAFLFYDSDIHWQLSMSIQEDIMRTRTFQSALELYRRCRRRLKKEYNMLPIKTGKKFKEQALPMTMDNLRTIANSLLVENEKNNARGQDIVESAIARDWLQLRHRHD